MESTTGDTATGLRRSATARALLFVSLIAAVGFVVLCHMVDAQRDVAHILDISGAQRMRSQRIAFLVAEGRGPNPVSGWRAELDATIDEMLEVRTELLARRDLLPTPPDASGNTRVGRDIGAYAAAARAFERDPRDGAAWAYVIAHRVSLLGEIDASVHGRAAIMQHNNRLLVAWLLIGLAAILVTIALVWKRLIEPSERRTAALVTKLNESEAQMRSLYRENPDSIAMYDRDGRILRGNRASRALLGFGDRLIGAHFTRHLMPSERGDVGAAFARALDGERVSFDTFFIAEDGESIDVHASLFPSVVGGRTTGVIGVAKDMRALRRAERAYAAQSERITELYRVAAYQNRSWNIQVGETLAVAAQRLEYEWALATAFVDGETRVISVVGEPGVGAGDVLSLPNERLQGAMRTPDVWNIDDLAASEASDGLARRGLLWGSLAGAPIVGNANVQRSVVLGSRVARKCEIDGADRDFLRLVAALIAASIQRGEHEGKLDALAFFDALTGLPNRVLFADRVAEMLNAASRRKLSFAVHCLDLDRFKLVNDTHGHAAGDEVLRIAAHRMQQCLRASDTLARLGGDEFVIVQALDAEGHGAEELAVRIIDAFTKPFVTEQFQAVLGVSIGISLYPSDGADAQSLLRRADEALLEAKRCGRNRRAFAA